MPISSTSAMPARAVYAAATAGVPYSHRRAVGAVNEFDLHADLREREPGVAVGREVDVGDDDLVPPRVVERGRDGHEGRRDRGLEGDLVEIRAEDAREVRAQVVEEA